MSQNSEGNNTIVLSMFGTSVEHALPGLLHVRDRVIARFPQTPVLIVFTSKIIRNIWHERAVDPDYLTAHPEIPEEVLKVQGIKTVMVRLLEERVDSLVVQPVHIAPVGRDTDPGSPAAVLDGIEAGKFISAPHRKLGLGRPALGTYGTIYPYTEDVVTVARSLSQDVALAKQKQAALFYMGHGNRLPATSGVYRKLVEELRRQYPDILTVMSLVEGASSFDETVAELKAENIDKILLKPFMLVAGDHVRKDMVGNGPNTLKTRLEEEGFTVLPLLTGLGENTAFADIFVQHVADAARDAGIELT